MLDYLFNFMKNKILSIVVVLLLFSSCKEDKNIISPNSISFFSIGGSGNNGYELLRDFDRPNLVGVIELISEYENKFYFDLYESGNFEHYQGISFDIGADIANPQKSELVSLSPASIVVNAFQLVQYDRGRYYVPSYLGDVENYFGGGYNKIVIDSNRYFNKVIDSVTFGEAISITNIRAGKEVHREEDFIIDFSGASDNSLIEWQLRLINEKYTKFVDSDSTRFGRILLNMQRNERQIIIDKDILKLMKSGYYNLDVTALEPKYINLSNGTQICVLGTSQYKTTILILND